MGRPKGSKNKPKFSVYPMPKIVKHKVVNLDPKVLLPLTVDAQMKRNCKALGLTILEYVEKTIKEKK